MMLCAHTQTSYIEAPQWNIKHPWSNYGMNNKPKLQLQLALLGITTFQTLLNYDWYTDTGILVQKRCVGFVLFFFFKR